MSPSLGSCRGCLPFLGAARIFCGDAGSVFKGTIEHENVEKKGIISKIIMRVNIRGYRNTPLHHKKGLGFVIF